MSAPASLTIIATHGGFWCRVCQAFTGPTEETAGEVWARCERCHQAGVLEWKPPTLQGEINPKPPQTPKRSRRILP